ncbi:MAG: hypothetical protein MZV64_71745 [Ignavibacteriales bacterium]|nr:hypothetical protein [Ignavibacteriales bacterium]
MRLDRADLGVVRTPALPRAGSVQRITAAAPFRKRCRFPRHGRRRHRLAMDTLGPGSSCDPYPVPLRPAKHERPGWSSLQPGRSCSSTRPSGFTQRV